MIRQPCNNDNTTLQTTPDLSDHDTVAAVAPQNKQSHNSAHMQLLHKQPTVSASQPHGPLPSNHIRTTVIAQLSHGCRTVVARKLCQRCATRVTPPVTAHNTCQTQHTHREQSKGHPHTMQNAWFK